MTTLAERFKTILSETGLNEAALAKMTRGVVTQQGLNKISNGATLRPSGQTVAAICKATGYRTEWLLSGAGAKKADADSRNDRDSRDGLDPRQKRILLAGVKEGLRQRGLDPDSPDGMREALAAYDKAEASVLADLEKAG